MYRTIRQGVTVTEQQCKRERKKVSSNWFQRRDDAAQNDRLAMFKDEQCGSQSKVTDDTERLLRRTENRLQRQIGRLWKLYACLTAALKLEANASSEKVR